jgi:transketolase
MYSDEDLRNLSLAVREHVIRMSADGGCFIGASLSCADVLVHLYARILRISKDAPNDPDRDYLLLSKGHGAPALYGTLLELGFVERAQLDAHSRAHRSVYRHPDRAIPGIEFHSGSLGHLLSVGIGIALDIRLRGGKNRVFVVVGDGELDEGSMWEAMLVANAQALDHLVVVVDRNQFQAGARTEELVPLEPLDQKLADFGFAVTTVNGHDFGALESASRSIPHVRGKPTAIIAETVYGKGLPSIEASARGLVSSTRAEAEVLLAELRGAAKAAPASGTPVVR